jgi:hypothetical protein
MVSKHSFLFFTILSILLFSKIVSAELAVWHTPQNPKINDTVNIYANISFDCFNKIESKYRVNSGNWQAIWNGGWPSCQTNLTSLLLNHNNSNTGKALGPFNKGEKVEYSVTVAKDGNVLQTVTGSFEIAYQKQQTTEKNLQKYIWIFSAIAIVLIIVIFITKKLRSKK